MLASDGRSVQLGRLKILRYESPLVPTRPRSNINNAPITWAAPGALAPFPLLAFGQGNRPDGTRLQPKTTGDERSQKIHASVRAVIT